MNGIEDLHQASLVSMETMFTRYMGDGNEAMARFFCQMYGQTFWSLIQGSYEFHIHQMESGQHAMEEERAPVNTQSLLQEIEALDGQQEAAAMDSKPFSDSYKKGSINKK